MNPDITSALVDFFPLVVPEAILALAACALFVGATFRQSRHLWGAVTLAALAAAGLAFWLVPRPDWAGAAARAAVCNSPLWLDGLAGWVKVVGLVGGAVLVLCGWNEVPDAHAAEYFACLLLITAGVGLTGSANDLVTLFLALELISIPTYVLLYLPRVTSARQEAAMKYFLLSVFSSALLLFGFSYLYGLSGTTNVPTMLNALGRAAPQTVPGGSDGSTPGLPSVSHVALLMVLAGLGFRITAFPFHAYAPDVYQGTTTAAAALLAFVPKLAGFVALLRVLGYVPYFLPNPAGGELLGTSPQPGFALGSELPIFLWFLAAVTMTFGNLLALLQDNVKRILAYSSVAHAGYMLIGLAAAPHLAGTSGGLAAAGVEAVLFYLVAYGAMTVGAFAVLGYLSTPERPVEKVDDLAGLSGSHPGVALLMALFLFSLIGIPVTAGFVGKLLLFGGALAVPSGQGRLFRVLALIGVLNAAIGGWYYLRILAVMYLRGSLRPVSGARSWPGLAALWACAAVTLLAGVWPQLFWQPVRDAMPPRTQGRQTASQEAVPGGR